MSKRILIDAAYPDSIQVAVVEKNRLVDLESSTNSKKMIKGNIYLAKVTRVEPSLQAAFIDYGGEKNGFIPFAEIHSDYYNVPSKHRLETSSQNDEEEEKHIELLPDDEAPSHCDLRSDFDVIVDEVLEDSTSIEVSSDEGDIEKIKQQNAQRYKIQEVIRRNQILLVQVVKEERGNKGASFTTYISLAGRYCVIMPNSGSKGGISKKIEDQEERRRLKIIVDDISATNTLGVIIRTVGHGKSRESIESDYNYLIKLWNEVREKTLISNAPAFIHSEENIFKRIVKDFYDNSVESIVVEGNEAYRDMKDTIENMSSDGELNLVLYDEKTPIFNKYKVSEQILSLYNPVAYMESGAYIVINPTEALTAIDVNSGKSTSEKNIEKMALKTNLEAAKEIVRQLKLRDISGIIVIDFIDMVETKNKRLVEKTLRELLYTDRAKVQVGYISNLGLLEVSRQRLKPTFLESNTVQCVHCHGKGVVRSYDANAITILKTIEGEVYSRVEKVNVFVAPETAMYVLNNKRDYIKSVEDKHNIQIIFHQDHKMSTDGFALEVVEGEKKRGSDNVMSSQTVNPSSKSDKSMVSDSASEISRSEGTKGNGDSNKGFNRKRRYGRQNRNRNNKGSDTKPSEAPESVPVEGS